MKKKKTVIKLLLVLVIFISTMAVMFNIYLNQMRYVKLPEDDENLGIKNEEIQKQETENETVEKGDILVSPNKADETKNSEFDGKIINIALIGGDRRNKKEASHADSIIILSIDTVHKKIKISSIMRDTYVKVQGHGRTKLSHSYAYGGPKLTIRTLNENFNLDIRDYVFIDFYGFEKLIDSLGGVEVDVKKYEISEINKYIKEVAAIRKTKAKLLKKPGPQTLNGQQALSYTRIRKVGNGDFARTNRQRQVLDVVLKKISEKGALQFPVIAAAVLPYVETSLSKTDIIKTGLYVLTSGMNTIEEKRFPADGYWKGKTIDKIWYLVADIEATKKQMREFIYENKSQASNNSQPEPGQNSI